MRAASAAAVRPPAASMASATRAPAGSSWRPGVATAPATWTTSTARLVEVPAVDAGGAVVLAKGSEASGGSAGGRRSHSGADAEHRHRHASGDDPARRRAGGVGEGLEPLPPGARGRRAAKGPIAVVGRDGGGVEHGPSRGATRQPHGGRTRPIVVSDRAWRNGLLRSRGPPSRPRSPGGSAGRPPSGGSAGGATARRRRGSARRSRRPRAVATGARAPARGGAAAPTRRPTPA